MCIPKHIGDISSGDCPYPIPLDNIELQCKWEFEEKKNIYLDLSDNLLRIKTETEVFLRYIKANRWSIEKLKIFEKNPHDQKEKIADLIDTLKESQNCINLETITRKFYIREERKVNHLFTYINEEFNTWQGRLQALHQEIKNIQSKINKLNQRLTKVKSKSFKVYDKFLFVTLKCPYFSTEQLQILKTIL